MPLIAWLVRDWFWIGIIAVVPGILVFLTFPFLPESPRWLCAKGRFDEAQEVLERVAKVNGNFENIEADEMQEKLQNFHERLQRTLTLNSREGFRSLFGHWRLARNIVMLSIVW